MVKKLEFTRFRNKCNKIYSGARNKFDKDRILNCKKNIRKLWVLLNDLLGNNSRQD